MSPTIKVGGLIIVKEVSPQNIQEGDVITFRSSSTDNVTTHRVIDIENANGIKFVTKGDANNVQDPNPIDSSFLVGKVVKFIPYLGAVAMFIQKYAFDDRWINYNIYYFYANNKNNKGAN